MLLLHYEGLRVLVGFAQFKLLYLGVFLDPLVVSFLHPEEFFLNLFLTLLLFQPQLLVTDKLVEPIYTLDGDL